MTSQQFAEIRLEMGLTQKTLAHFFGSHQPEIARIENGQPTKKHAALIRALLLLHRHGLINRLRQEIFNEKGGEKKS